MEWTLDALWELPISDDDEEIDFAPYSERADALGLGTREAYKRDLDDPRWLEREDDGAWGWPYNARFNIRDVGRLLRAAPIC